MEEVAGKEEVEAKKVEEEAVAEAQAEEVEVEVEESGGDEDGKRKREEQEGDQPKEEGQEEGPPKKKAKEEEGKEAKLREWFKESRGRILEVGDMEITVEELFVTVREDMGLPLVGALETARSVEAQPEERRQAFLSAHIKRYYMEARNRTVALKSCGMHGSIRVQPESRYRSYSAPKRSGSQASSSRPGPGVYRCKKCGQIKRGHTCTAV